MNILWMSLSCFPTHLFIHAIVLKVNGMNGGTAQFRPQKWFAFFVSDPFVPIVMFVSDRFVPIVMFVSDPFVP